MIKPLLTGLLATGSFLVPIFSVSAATLAYDFNGTAGTQPAGPPAWSSVRVTGNGTGSTFSQNGSGSYSNTMSVTASSSTPNGQIIDYGGFQLSDRSAGTNFSLTSSFTSAIANGSTTWNAQAGVRALASAVDAESTASWYQVLVYSANSPGANSGRVALEKRWFDTSLTTPAWVTTTLYQSSAVATGILNLGLNSGGTFTITLNGTYNGTGDLTLGFTVANSNGTTHSGSGVDLVGGATGGPLTGSYFGVRDRLRNFTGSATPITLTTNYDNFNLTYTAVPEPSAVILVGTALGVLCLRRRRSAFVR